MASAQAQSLFQNGSTTYFTASLFFPPTIREGVFTLYAFVRSADNYVDATPQDVRGFYQFVKNYQKACSGGSVSDQVITEFVQLQREYEIPQAWVDAFLLAMEADLYKKKYATLRELQLYMYGSAEVIGLMLCKIMGVKAKGYTAARLLGRAMQYANFLRDIAEDMAMGRQYIPVEITSQYGFSNLQQKIITKNSAAFEKLFIAEVERYKTWNEAAILGFVYLPLAVRIPVAAASMMYTWTLDELCKNPIRVCTVQLKPTKWRVVAAVLERTYQEFWNKA